MAEIDRPIDRRKRGNECELYCSETNEKKDMRGRKTERDGKGRNRKK